VLAKQSPLERASPHTSEIAENIGFTRPTAFTDVKQMPRQGWLATRNLNDGDGRAPAITPDATRGRPAWRGSAGAWSTRIRHGFLASFDRQAAAHFLSSLDTLLEGATDRFRRTPVARLRSTAGNTFGLFQHA